MDEDRRERTHGYYIKGPQFWTALVLVLTVLGLTPFAVARWVLDQAIEDHVRIAIEKHDVKPDAHAAQFKVFLDVQRAGDVDVARQLNDINTRLSRIEGAVLAVNAPRIGK